eukprot:gene2760-3191_t
MDVSQPAWSIAPRNSSANGGRVDPLNPDRHLEKSALAHLPPDVAEKFSSK